MSHHQRPWWLVVNQSGGFITTIQEESEPGKQRFLVRGEPFIQGLAWLIWGPVGALIGVTLMTAIAIFFDIRSQSWLIKSLFIGIFLVVPGVLWIAFTVL
ncbi:MAG: hypothetical protein R3264_19890, partial [Anaerolineae bacterium]|nr:hypothetical protein [Anaerolineae bacterium]